ncbi:transcriptional regulator ATRX homolog [Acropora muricata]|uniref:transcriptional regulator ATRX homolog n=1 Tax=Acropora muricata TaxID=159855 RepID=UPI0034E4CF6A
MAGNNVLKQQLKTGNVDMPSLSGALKESGAVSIELPILPEHPEETSGSTSEETETGRKKERNTDKGTDSTGDEPKKQAMTRKKKVKQQLQIGNVNVSSESRPLKRSGAERIVHASIHGRPKKTRGCLNKERKPAGKNETNAEKVALDKEEEPEKNRLPQDNLQQEIRQMRRKSPSKQQLQTGNFNTPSKSRALKKRGAVRIVHASIHERPKKTRGSVTEEKKAVEEKEKVAEKVAFEKGEETEKRRPPQDNLQQEIRPMRSKNPLTQQLPTDKVNNPPASGALKKKGAVDFVLVTIHEQPKEASGSPSEERGTDEMKQGDDNQVEINISEEELEETRF